MHVPLGQVLVQMGLLSSPQVDAILAEQQRTGEPFGLICERLFQVEPSKVEEAWASQYVSMAPHVCLDSEQIEPAALDIVSRRQAWQFCVLPLRLEGRELVLATTARHLRRALRFATAVLGLPVYIVLADPEQLGQALSTHYPLPGMTSKMIGAGLEN